LIFVKKFSNGLKNPTDNAFSVGFFYPLEISFLVGSGWSGLQLIILLFIRWSFFNPLSQLWAADHNRHFPFAFRHAARHQPVLHRRREDLEPIQ
jgi:hypothetical protein